MTRIEIGSHYIIERKIKFTSRKMTSSNYREIDLRALNEEKKPAKLFRFSCKTSPSNRRVRVSREFP
jgi:hypothetical protein